MPSAAAASRFITKRFLFSAGAAHRGRADAGAAADPGCAADRGRGTGAASRSSRATLWMPARHLADRVGPEAPRPHAHQCRACAAPRHRGARASCSRRSPWRRSSSAGRVCGAPSPARPLASMNSRRRPRWRAGRPPAAGWHRRRPSVEQLGDSRSRAGAGCLAHGEPCGGACRAARPRHDVVLADHAAVVAQRTARPDARWRGSKEKATAIFGQPVVERRDPGVGHRQRHERRREVRQIRKSERSPTPQFGLVQTFFRGGESSAALKRSPAPRKKTAVKVEPRHDEQVSKLVFAQEIFAGTGV